MWSRLGLQAKIFVYFVALVLALVGGVLIYSYERTSRLAQDSLDEALSTTRSLYENLEVERLEKLELVSSLVAESPIFKAVVAETDAATVLDSAREMVQQVGSDFMIVTDDEGVVLARTDAPNQVGEDYSETPLVRAALEWESAGGVWSDGEKLFHVVSVPLTVGPSILGSVTTGYQIDDQLAHYIKRFAGCEVVFCSGIDDRQRIVGSTLTKGMETLNVWLTENKELGETESLRLSLEGEDYQAIIVPMAAVGEGDVGAFAALRSRDRELAVFRAFQRSVLLVGVVTLGLAVLASFVVSRGITRPIKQLVTLADRMREGDYASEVEVNRADEIGSLARSFQALKGELREKALMEKYLSQSATEMIHTVRQRSVGDVRVETNSTNSAEAQPTVAVVQKPSTELGPGSVLGGRYELQRILGSGGMGVVYLAQDRELDEQVAIKLLRPDIIASDPAILERFKQEIRVARRVTHRNVVRTYDFGDMDGVKFISMEYVQGITLKQLIKKKGALPLEVSLRIGKQASAGLAAAHHQSVVHRDVKPQNIILTPASEVKIMDFGIARPAGSGDMTATGLIIGTPDYMSPEQVQGKRDLDHRSDIYSLGVVFYEMFTGVLPFAGDTAISIAMKHVQELPLSPRTISPGLPVPLDRIILRCLQKDPTKRYQRVEDLQAALVEPSILQA